MNVSEQLDYQETIALLQEEVVRLENELRLRDEAGADDPHQRGNDAAVDAAASGQVSSLLDELANREETINLLLEQRDRFLVVDVFADAHARPPPRWGRRFCVGLGR